MLTWEKRRIVIFSLLLFFFTSLLSLGVLYWYTDGELWNYEVGKLRIKKKGIYTYVQSEEMGTDRFLQGTITEAHTDGSFSLRVKDSDRIINLILKQGATLFSWQEGENQAHHGEELELGDQVLVSGISELSKDQIEVSRITVLR